MTVTIRHAVLLFGTSLALVACNREADMSAANGADTANAASGVTAEDAMAASAPRQVQFTGGDGKTLGTVDVSSEGSGSTLVVEASGMPAGTHGIHLHAKGLCEGPKFESAGAHWNPGNKQHGSENPQGAHLGDLPNIEIGANGSGRGSFTVAGADAGAIGDADGTALVIHAKADDYKTDPSGDSGDRIACAVLAAPR